MDLVCLKNQLKRKSPLNYKNEKIIEVQLKNSSTVFCAQTVSCKKQYSQSLLYILD